MIGFLGTTGLDLCLVVREGGLTEVDSELELSRTFLVGLSRVGGGGFLDTGGLLGAFAWVGFLARFRVSCGAT